MTNIDDFKKLSPLVDGYELDPEKIYLIVCDGKAFNFGAAASLFSDIRQMHPNIQIAVVATLKPKLIEVREKQDGTTGDVSGREEAGQSGTGKVED